MRHTAGFAYGAGPTPAHDAFVAADPLALTNTLAEASRRIGGLPLLFQPGTRWSYSAAVDVQAALGERLAGDTSADYRSEGRRVGTEGVSTCISWWSPYLKNKTSSSIKQS